MVIGPTLFFLLSSNGLLRALASASVRVGALTTDRKATTVTEALVRTNLHLALDVLAGLATQIAFDLQVLFDERTNLCDLGIGQVSDSGRWLNRERLEEIPAGGVPYAEDVRQADLNLLLAWDIDAGNTCHGVSPASACVGD